MQAASLSGGTTIASILDFVSPIREQWGKQMPMYPLPLASPEVLLSGGKT
jgi:hypothetical protein